MMSGGGRTRDPRGATGISQRTPPVTTLPPTPGDSWANLTLSWGLSFPPYLSMGSCRGLQWLSPPCCLSRLTHKWEEKIPNPSKSQLFQVGPAAGGCGGKGSSALCPCPRAHVLLPFLGACIVGHRWPGRGWEALRARPAPVSSSLQTPGLLVHRDPAVRSPMGQERVEGGDARSAQRGSGRGQWEAGWLSEDRTAGSGWPGGKVTVGRGRWG